jgi:DNA repair protein RadA/Sms
MKTQFVCQACGRTSSRWVGRCPECEAWDSFVEEVVPAAVGKGAKGGGRRSVGDVAAVARPISEIEDETAIRVPSGLPSLDRVLGGGVVVGGATLLAGEPGIGKSTLLLALADAIATSGRTVLYASAEESPRQLKLRAERLGCRSPRLLVVGETLLEGILGAIEAERPDVVVVDSVQALRSADLDGPPGSIGQVRHGADRLVEAIKKGHRALFLVGHVTKEGTIAGPKSLEHLVDTVLTFEGDRTLEHRVLRATKNRFGATGEVALFAMRDDGLAAIENASRALLDRRQSGTPGSAVVATIQGTRPVLVEVQALVHSSGLPQPRRVSIGLDPQRSTLLTAVLQRFCRLSLGDQDVFVNVVGGLALREPAVDLGVAAALLSATRRQTLPEDAAYFGEIGLLGEIRPVARPEARLREIELLGFRRVIAPRYEGRLPAGGLEWLVVDHVVELDRLVGG